MFKKSIISVFVLSAAVFSTSAFAQGMYIAGSAGLGMAASSVKTDTDAGLTTLGYKNLNTSVANGTAMDGTLGYAFSPNFAAEAGYFNSGTLAYSGTFTGGTVRSDIKITGFRLAVVGIAPLSDQFSVFGKLGWGMYTNDSAATVTVGTVAVSASDSVKKNSVGYGAGVMYKLVDNVSLRASYEMIGSDVSAFLVGVQFKF
jgi:OOP family OmpA-OmpF porin